MSTLEEIADDLQRELSSFSKAVESMKKRSIEERRAAIPQFNNRVNKTKNLIETFNYEIETQESRHPGIGKFQAQSNQFKASLKQIEQQIEYLKSEGVKQDDLYKGAKSAGTTEALHIDPNTRDRKELIQLGKNTQQQGIEALDRAARDIKEMDIIGVEVQMELNKQIEQLDRIYDTVKDTETTLKRAQKYVIYFARQVYTDRCLMAMIVLIVIAIVVIIILSAVGVGKGSFNLPDQVKPAA